jgi:hypothetical protein
LGNIRPENDTTGPFGSLFDEDSIFRQIGNTLDKLDRIVPGGTDLLIGKLNQTLGTTSLYNEVTPLLSSAIAVKAGADPIAVLRGLQSVENDNPSVNIPQNITSNSTVIGNNNYTAQRNTDLNIGNPIVQPTNYNSAAHPRKMSDIYLSRNNAQPVVNNANYAIKNLQLQNRITSVQDSLNKAASGVTPLTAEQTASKRRELLNTTQQYTNINGQTALASWQNKSGVTVNPNVGVGPKTQSQNLASTTTEDIQ